MHALRTYLYNAACMAQSRINRFESKNSLLVSADNNNTVTRNRSTILGYNAAQLTVCKLL